MSENFRYFDISAENRGVFSSALDYASNRMHSGLDLFKSSLEAPVKVI